MYAWRLTVPAGHRYDTTQALRQVLNRAVAWGLVDYNPAFQTRSGAPKRSGRSNPGSRSGCSDPARPVYGPMVIFADATGLRPSELFGLDGRDVDRAAGVVYVRRAYANGRLKHTKTR